VREVLDHLDVDSQPSYTTVLTMMRLMQGKGYVTRDESARAHVYSARIPERPAKRALVRDLINKVFGGSADALLVRLLEDERVSREDIERAKRAVAKRSRRRG
jgi:predicted transcriptional regulator